MMDLSLKDFITIAIIAEWDISFKVVEIHISEHLKKDKKMEVELIFGSAIIKYIQENGEVGFHMAQEYTWAVEMKKNTKVCFQMD